ncbi:MAG: TIGR00296 family protein [Methanosarcinales archaeon]|nr:TIGR00296 family protein [Methanosarcinales archaeon]
MLNKEEGNMALDMARRAIQEYLASSQTIRAEDLPSVFYENRGVFVTLNNRYDTGKELRGCIGRPYPVMPLSDAIIISAINAATEDPRFNPVTPGEMGTIEIEITVLTMPERLEGKKSELPGKIEVGRHGLIIQRRGYSGLLLPQVAVEHGFDSEEFLGQTCMKAGLFFDAWLEVDTEVFAFEGQIFHED